MKKKSFILPSLIYFTKRHLIELPFNKKCLNPQPFQFTNPLFTTTAMPEEDKEAKVIGIRGHFPHSYSLLGQPALFE